MREWREPIWAMRLFQCAIEPMHGIRKQLDIAAGAGLVHADGFAPLPLGSEQAGFGEKVDLSFAVWQDHRLHQTHSGGGGCMDFVHGPTLRWLGVICLCYDFGRTEIGR